MVQYHMITECVKTGNESVYEFPNGYKVIVRTGKGTATTVGAPYELELVPLNSVISDDRIGYCTDEEIKDLLNEISRLPRI